MTKTIKSTFLVTIFILAGQCLAFVTQIVIAAFFGADANMDAFLAANAAPQYLMAALIGSIGLILIPVFVEYAAAGREEEAWQVASTVINFCLLAFGLFTVIGIVFADVILRCIAPGLSGATHSMAVKIALVAWPGILFLTAISLLTSVYQSQLRFVWPAAVPVLGAAANLVMIAVFSRWWGVVGLAVATTCGLILQTSLLVPIVTRSGHYRLALDWRHPGVARILTLLAPLVFVNIISKATPVVERFLASSMPEGSISHLNYAFSLSAVVAMILSTGITTVIFPSMAVNAASNDMEGFRRNVSSSLRYMWLMVAPAAALGIALALPLASAFYLRGRFDAADAMAVAGLLQIYLLSLIGACLGNITGRSFIALKDTRTIAVIGSLESVAYLFYTYHLAGTFGTAGVAWGFVILYNVSFLWQAFVIRYKTGNVGGRTVVDSFARIGLAAIVAGIMAWFLSNLSSNSWGQLVLGSVAGVIGYIAVLFALKVSEARSLLGHLFGVIK